MGENANTSLISRSRPSIIGRQCTWPLNFWQICLFVFFVTSHWTTLKSEARKSFTKHYVNFFSFTGVFCMRWWFKVNELFRIIVQEFRWASNISNNKKVYMPVQCHSSVGCSEKCIELWFPNIDWTLHLLEVLVDTSFLFDSLFGKLALHTVRR